MIELTIQINRQVQEDVSSRSGFLQLWKWRVWKQLRQSLGGLTGLRQLRDFAEV